MFPLRELLRNPAPAQLAMLLLALFLISILPAARAETAAEEPATTAPIRDKWAVVIGISKFKDKRIHALQYPAKDARDFASFLVNKGNFARDHVRLLVNEQATQDNILDTIGGSWLPRRVLPNDLVVVYFSSHGSPQQFDVRGENFLVAYDSSIDRLFATGIELADLGPGIQRRTECKRVVLLLDACHSGAAGVESKGLSRKYNFDLANINSLAGEGLFVISSSSANQRSWESKRYNNGVFTRKLIDSLKLRGESTDLIEAFDNLRDQVQAEVKFDRRCLQTPVIRSKWKGKKLILTARPTAPRKVLDEAPGRFAPPPVSPEPNQVASASIKNKNMQRTGQEKVAPHRTNRTVASQTAGAGAQSGGSLAGRAVKNRQMLSDRVAFVGVIPPKRYDVKMKPAYGVVEKKDLDGISHFPGIFAQEIQKQLQNSLGALVTDRKDVLTAVREVAGSASSGVPSRIVVKRLAARSNSRYIAYVFVTQFSFLGQKAWSNVYKIKTLVKIYDGKTGLQKAQFRKNYGKQPWLGDSTTWWVDYVHEKCVPKLAKDIATAIVRRL